MNTPPFADRLAVCSWSLQPASPQDLAARVAETGLRQVQLALDPVREVPAIWGKAKDVLRGKGIAILSGMFGCVGEDYTSLESIRRTGGIAPDETWEQNWNQIRVTAVLAQQMGLELVTFHAGFLPHEERDPSFGKMLRRLGEVGDIFNAAGLAIALETGQETAPVLVHLLQKLKRANVGVNFDPANMLLYDKGDPIQALRLLGPWVRQVHIKDARRTRQPGTWGEEVPAGSGEVDWPAFFATLTELNFAGNLVIEREAGSQRLADIRQAKAVIQRCVEAGD
jgi:sugar phosphate isomerase/epimerase